MNKEQIKNIILKELNDNHREKRTVFAKFIIDGEIYDSKCIRYDTIPKYLYNDNIFIPKEDSIKVTDIDNVVIEEIININDKVLVEGSVYNVCGIDKLSTINLIVFCKDVTKDYI